MKNLVKRFIRDEAGLELSEYAIMVALIVIVLLAAIGFLSGAIANAFSRTGAVINSGTTGS